MEIVNEIQWLPPLFKCCSIQVEDPKESEEEAHKSSPGIQDKMRLSGYFTLKKIIRDSDNSRDSDNNEINPSRSAELTLSISANMFLFYFGIRISCIHFFLFTVFTVVAVGLPYVPIFCCKIMFILILMRHSTH